MLAARRDALTWLDGLQRPRRWARGRAIAAGLVLLVLAAAGWRFWTANLSEIEIHTARGEMQRVTLPDGTIVEADVATRLVARASLVSRSVRLYDGRAHFTVAHDRLRPFAVTADNITARDIGTTFDVAIIGPSVSVTVEQGVVAVADDTGRWNERLGVAQRLTEARETGQCAIATVDLTREQVWRDGRLDADNRPLGGIIDEFQRYSEVAILLDDPALRDMRVSGLVDLRDPHGFARGLARVRRLKIVEDTPTRIRLAAGRDFEK